MKNPVIPLDQQLTIEKLIRISRSRLAASVLLEMAGCNWAHVNYMASPVAVCHLSTDAEQLPPKLIELILLSRLEAILMEIQEKNLGRQTDKIATLVEVWAYLYPAAILDRLPNEEWNHIWMWLADELSRKYPQEEDFFRQFANPHADEFRLSSSEYVLYSHLSRYIWSWTGREDNPYLNLDEQFYPPVIREVSFETCFRGNNFLVYGAWQGR